MKGVLNMEKGLAIIEVNEAETRSIFIDQDALECARLNALTKKRLAKAEAARRKEYRNRRKAEKVAAQRKAYNLDTIKYILIRGGIIGAMVWAGLSGMAHPIICVLVTVYCLCTAFLRLGAWFGRCGK